jgi:enoyl-CoA hydratase
MPCPGSSANDGRRGRSGERPDRPACAAAEELEDVTVAYAETLAANAPLSIRASKFFINQLGLERSQRDEPLMDAMQREAANSEDFKEATRSFIEKRKPVFHGR